MVADGQLIDGQHLALHGTSNGGGANCCDQLMYMGSVDMKMVYLLYESEHDPLTDLFWLSCRSTWDRKTLYRRRLSKVVPPMNFVRFGSWETSTLQLRCCQQSPIGEEHVSIASKK